MPLPVLKSLPTMTRPSGMKTGAWPNVYGWSDSVKGAELYGLSAWASGAQASRQASAATIDLPQVIGGGGYPRTVVFRRARALNRARGLRSARGQRPRRARA